MKNSIKLTALLMVLSTAIFAAAPKTTKVTFSSLAAKNGIAVKVDDGPTGKAIVMIYDKDGNVLRKDVLSANASEKGYIMNKLENGDYTIEVTSNRQVVTRDVHVYDEGQTKMFFIKG